MDCEMNVAFYVTTTCMSDPEQMRGNDDPERLVKWSEYAAHRQSWSFRGSYLPVASVRIASRNSLVRIHLSSISTAALGLPSYLKAMCLHTNFSGPTNTTWPSIIWCWGLESAFAGPCAFWNRPIIMSLVSDQDLLLTYLLSQASIALPISFV